MSLKSNYIFIFISCILGILFYYSKSILILFFFLLFLLFVLKKINYKFSIVLILIFIFFNFYKLNKIPNISNDYCKENYIVNEIKQKYLIIKNNNIFYLLYEDDCFNYQVNDEIYVEGKITKIQNDLAIDVFEFKDYLNNKRVFFQIDATKVEIIKHNESISHKIINQLTFKLQGESYKMSKMLLFNDRFANIELYENLKEINAIHLFVVSGFHILFFFKLICLIFKKFKVFKIILGLLICTFYVFLLDFSLSSFRALISLVLSIFFKERFNSLDRVSISGILFLVIEPLNVFNYSFILTFVMCISILFSNNILKKSKTIIRVLGQSAICFLTIIPIQLLLNYKINFISLFTNIILSYIVMIIFVLCLVGIALSFINGNIFSNVFQAFNHLIEDLSLLPTSLVLGSLKSYMVIFYYLLLLLFLYQLEHKNFKRIICSFSFILMFFVMLYNRNHFIFYQRVTFLNVYQGDCCVIQDSFNGKVMLIDTGGLRNYDIAKNNIIPYLHFHGIRKIDLVVITHDDYDHNGALTMLNKYIVIDKIIEDSSIKQINFGKIEFTNLNKYWNEKTNQNDQSIVLYANICSLNFLFTGDISQNIEKNIIADLPDLKVDVLKVAHHGSKFSSSEDFIKIISPTYAIISVGENNHYGHPNQEVMNTLLKNNVIIYQTSQDGTIRFIGKIFDKYFIQSAK